MQKGSKFLLKIGDGGGPETFTTIGGLQQTGFSLQNEGLESTNLDSGEWRKINGGIGIKSVAISGSGLFTDSATEESLRAIAFASNVNNYEIEFENGDKLTGPFFITGYERSGDIDGEETYSIALESAGSIVFAVG